MEIVGFVVSIVLLICAWLFYARMWRLGDQLDVLIKQGEAAAKEQKALIAALQASARPVSVQSPRTNPPPAPDPAWFDGYRLPLPVEKPLR